MRQIDIMMDHKKKECEAEVRGLELRLQAVEHELRSSRRVGEQRVVEVPAPSVQINAISIETSVEVWNN